MHPAIAQALKPFTPPAQRDYLVTVNGIDHTVSAQSCSVAILQAMRSQFEDDKLPERLSIHARPVRSSAHSVHDHDPLAL